MAARSDADVIIIGAGAAGLRAAMELVAAGRRVMVVEGRERVGGRIHTLHPAESAVPLELGAEFIHGKPAETLALLRRFNIAYVDAVQSHRVFVRGKLQQGAGLWETFEKVVAGAKRLGKKDATFDEYLTRFKPADAVHRKAAQSFVRGFDAAFTDRISARQLMLDQEAAGDEADALFRIPAGYDALIEGMLGVVRVANVWLSTVVHGVRWNKRGAVVEVERLGQRQTLRARQVIVTVPLGVLKAGSIAFDPPLEGKRWAIAHLEMGPVVRTQLLFKEAFWETLDGGEELAFMHDWERRVPTWWTQLPMRAPVLTGWAGGPAGAYLTGLSEADRLVEVIEALSHLLRMKAERIRGQLRAVYWGEWQTDVLARGAYSYVAVNGVGARDRLAEPVERTLFFAGEATTSSGQTGTVEAALVSGVRAAGAVLR